MNFYIDFARKVDVLGETDEFLCQFRPKHLEGNRRMSRVMSADEKTETEKRRFIRKLSLTLFLYSVLYWNTEHRQNRFFREKSGWKCFRNISVSVNFAALIQFFEIN